MRNKIIALIPSYEPDETLCELLKALKQENIQTVVVDDGSGESFWNIFAVAEKYGAVLHHDKNRGKGRALKTGLAYIQEQNAGNCVVVTMDSDGQHTVEDALKAAKTAFFSSHSLVLGSRAFTGAVPAKSQFGNKITGCVYRLATGNRIRDTQTGLRAFSSELIPFLLDIPGERYEYEMNVLLECPKQGVHISEVEIQTLYFHENSGSHFHAVRDSFLIYREILKFTASSMAGFAVDYVFYALFSVLTAGMGTVVSLSLSNVLARVISAGVNFTVNRKLVFKSSKNLAASVLEYFFLAVCILAGNTIVLNFLAGQAGINRFAAKMMVEILFFFVSLFVQKTIIFEEKKG